MGSSLGVRALKVIVKVLAWMAVPIVIALTLVAVVTQMPERRTPPNADVVRSLDFAIDIDQAGTLHITETYEWDFGYRRGLGFYRKLVTAQGWEHDKSQMRVYSYGDFTASSPSGAPAEIWVEEAGYPEMTLSVGAPDGSSDRRSGVQTYVISYTAEGQINPIRGQSVSDRDELYYNIFNDTPVPVEKLSVRVSGPAGVIETACYQGPTGSTDSCSTHEADGPVATYTSTSVDLWSNFTILTAFPAGTFSNPGPILAPNTLPTKVDVRSVGDKVVWAYETFTIPAALAWAAALIVSAVSRLRRGRDETYVGLIPGTVPLPNQPAPVGMLTGTPSVAVRFTPPDGLKPADAILLDEKDVNDQVFTVTLIDLAARGHFTITRTPKDGVFDSGDTILTKVSGPTRGELNDYERRMLSSLFSSGRRVDLGDLRGEFADRYAKILDSVREHGNDNGWFRPPGAVELKPSLVSRIVKTLKTLLPMAVIGLIMLVAYMVITAMNNDYGDIAQRTLINLRMMLRALLSIRPPEFLRLPLLVLLIGGIVTVVVRDLTRTMVVGRSARGRALYDQSRGFKQYLMTAEADQLQWEEGQDIYSEYLPWAMAYGVEERWSRIFQQLADAGRYDLDQTWYVGDDRHNRSVSDLGRDADSVGRAASKSLSYTPGSSGSSGSSSGGSSGSSGGGSSGGSSGGGSGGGSFGGR